MQVLVSVRHGSLQAGDQQLIEEKVEKLRRLFDRITAIAVVVDLEHVENPTVDPATVATVAVSPVSPVGHPSQNQPAKPPPTLGPAAPADHAQSKNKRRDSAAARPNSARADTDGTFLRNTCMTCHCPKN